MRELGAGPVGGEGERRGAIQEEGVVGASQ